MITFLSALLIVASGITPVIRTSGGGASDCSDFSSLEVWYKQSDLPATSSSVATWSDSSGNGNDLTQSTENEKPISVTLGTGKGADFDNALADPDNMDNDSTISAAGVWTLATTLYLDDLSQGHYVYANSANATQMLYVETDGRIYTRILGSGVYITGTGVISATTQHTVIIGRDSSDDFFIYVDGVDELSGTPSLSGTYEVNQLGRRATETDYNLHGAIGEICLWLADHSASESDIRTYLEAQN